MTAKEKFKELGYELVSEEIIDGMLHGLTYVQGYCFISFSYGEKTGRYWIAYYDDLDRDEEPVTLDMEETKAVIMQLKELGWLE